MYCIDTGSDIVVSYRLFLSCHYFYGASVLSIVFLPGLVYGWYQYSQDEFSFKKALIFPIWFMPYSLWKLFVAIFNHSWLHGHTSTALDNAKLVKAFEMLFESFPQMVLGIFVVQGLQISEPLNLVSTVISTVSVIYGFGDYLSYVVKNDQGGAPFSVTVWGALASCIDTVFRSIFLAYLLTIVKGYTLLIVPLYVGLMLIAICIKKGNCIIGSEDLRGALTSFGCSAHESQHVDYTFRPLSKIVFACIFLPTLAFLTYATAVLPNLGQDVSTNLGDPKICANICPKVIESGIASRALNVTEVDVKSYCSSIWRHLEPSDTLPIPVAHFGFLLTLYMVLFALSILEGLLEAFAKWGAYCKLYEYEYEEPEYDGFERNPETGKSDTIIKKKVKDLN